MPTRRSKVGRLVWPSATFIIYVPSVADDIRRSCRYGAHKSYIVVVGQALPISP